MNSAHYLDLYNNISKYITYTSILLFQLKTKNIDLGSAASL